MYKISDFHDTFIIAKQIHNNDIMIFIENLKKNNNFYL